MAQVVSNQRDGVTYLFSPFLRKEKSGDTLYVWGKATGPQLDLDDQIVDSDWARDALGDWMKVANIRVQHNPSFLPAGKGIELKEREDGFWLRSKVVEPVAIRLVEEGILTGYSIGIKNPRIVTDFKARGGRIVGGKIVEVSLVDYPCLEEAKIVDITRDLQKGASSGITKRFVLGSTKGMKSVDEDTDEKYDHEAPEDDLDHEGEHTHEDGTTHSHRHHHEAGESDHDAEHHLDLSDEEEPEEEDDDDVEDVGKSADLTKCARDDCDCTCKAGSPDPSCDCDCATCAGARASDGEHEEREDTTKAGRAAPAKPRAPAKPAVAKRNFSTEERKRLAKEGKALPDGSYPIVTKRDVENAVKAFGRSNPGDRGRVKRHIERRARALGATDMLPEDWHMEKIFKSVMRLKSTFERVLSKSESAGDRESGRKAFEDFLVIMSEKDPIFDAMKMDIEPPNSEDMPDKGGEYDAHAEKEEESWDKDLESNLKSAVDAAVAPLLKKIGQMEKVIEKIGAQPNSAEAATRMATKAAPPESPARVDPATAERDRLIALYQNMAKNSTEGEMAAWASQELAKLHLIGR